MDSSGTTIHRLSPFLEFLSEGEWLAAGLDKLPDGDVAIYDQRKGKTFLVNEAIGEFLRFFTTPHSFYDLAEHFAKLTNSTEAEAIPVVWPFFWEMKQRLFILEDTDDFKQKMESLPEPLKENSVFENFTILKELKFSTPIEVYLAETQTHEKFILKRLFFSALNDESTRKNKSKKFLREYHIMEDLQGHPHICRLLEVNPEALYARIEYFEGKSLHRWVEDETARLTVSESISIFRQILDTLAYIHKKQYLHGDLHSANILGNNQHEIRVIDFDLSIHESEITKNSVMGGVHAYIPPERISENAFSIVESTPDYRSEVFQLGVIGYLLFYWDMPFDAPTWKKLAYEIMNTPAVFHPTNPAGEKIPEAVIAVLKKSLEKNPGARYASAIEMHAAFSEIPN